MRVCHVSPHLPPDQAANALLPAELAAWAHAQGHQVTLVAHEPAQGQAAVPLPSGQVWRLPRKPKATGLARALRLDTLRHARVISAALDQAAQAANLLHLHSNGLIVEVAAAWAARKRIPFVLTLYGTEIWHYKRRWPVDPFTRAYRGASAVTFYSRKLMERATELGLSREDLVVVYPTIAPAFTPQPSGTRAEWRAALGIREPQVVLNVKRLHELAGQRYLIDAFARATEGNNDVRLVICGTGALKETLEAQARASGAGDRITFAGLVANDQVARYAAVADVFVLPSLLEALPTVAVEALASGTPVISADHPGGVELHEVFADDVQVVAKADAPALAQALRTRLQSPRRVSARTLELVTRHFGRAPVHDAYDAVYRMALR
ncbi:MAG TPA: glycosyltransferase [Vicinamibacterales bacterium]|nr:glycosyltransferase [Vicinamibacterales bacterium]